MAGRRELTEADSFLEAWVLINGPPNPRWGCLFITFKRPVPEEMEHMQSFELQCNIYFSYSPRRNFRTCIHMDYNKDLISAFLATTVFYKAITYHSCSASELAFLLFFFFLKGTFFCRKGWLDFSCEDEISACGWELFPPRWNFEESHCRRQKERPSASLCMFNFLVGVLTYRFTINVIIKLHLKHFLLC